MMDDNFMTMGDALDQAIEAIGPDASNAVLDALDTILESAKAKGLSQLAYDTIGDFIGNQT